MSGLTCSTRWVDAAHASHTVAVMVFLVALLAVPHTLRAYVCAIIRGSGLLLAPRASVIGAAPDGGPIGIITTPKPTPGGGIGTARDGGIGIRIGVGIGIGTSVGISVGIGVGTTVGITVGIGFYQRPAPLPANVVGLVSESASASEPPLRQPNRF